jgi:cobalt-zinc-cadmium resistance protein CzcA
MLDRIIYFSIHNKLIIAILVLALIGWGTWAGLRLPIDAVPDITNNQVQVITYSPSLSPSEVERFITYPIELGLSNIPQLEEVRSISRFGLSVVTAVFSDETDVYWARQQVSERLLSASAQIPASLGRPELGPVSTGLSEIYQYTLEPEKGYEKSFNLADLRTIQDWTIRRNLLGTPGIADVSSFGGFVKQYEISIEPEKLRAMDISIQEVFDAVQKNNQNSGGSYIAKGSESWYIRSEGLLNNLDEIGQVVVKKTSTGFPVLVKDLATVRFGHSVRFGAMTIDNKGEAVGGIVLMLKGENSGKVSKVVAEKMEQIKKTLPKGLKINVFLDRSDLIDRAINTVKTNLMEGALIVIFVLVLILGNFRAGLIVASVIPLSLLFALGLMQFFGVSGNLMSLGAIDFGIIVDGAVIIVEATLHHLSLSSSGKKLNQQQMDLEVYDSASKIRSSAAFGEIIILIVYLPILALTGIEGKMFRPMAQTVAFAIACAFILSLTYVPMVSALFLSKTVNTKKGLSDKAIEIIFNLYKPVLNLCLQWKYLVISFFVLLFGLSLFVFSGLGGEFIPSLDEGDFAVETRLIPGTSLEKTIEVSLKAGEILKARFPEVKQVIGKIGTSEIPTDPMPFEACDMMIILKDKNEWKSAESKEELAEKMQEALSEIPGVNFGFQQPIQMRFNELMTGARQDVAIKIYGDDADQLAALAQKMGKIIQHVDGLKDLYIEQITGLPEMVAKINREKLAMYNLSVEDVNTAISSGFAGAVVGKVYEGEKNFDIAIRLDSASRNQIEDIRNLYVHTPEGQSIPISEVADVEFKLGPNQIQRDNARRRITVAFNVRGKDVETVVTEVQLLLSKKLKLPESYYFTVGGQFKNLNEAKDRLSLAVPIALACILLLLFFTFGSIKQSLVIFTAIPLSAIGGIFALWLRDMPFSISAGIGFIALFGVAVLNGIVLISEFNYLKKNGITNLSHIVFDGTKARLRPVLMTALVASLGFFPMAFSSGAGAEVQKPLATVVIGGLVSATILTLFILPILYWITEKKQFSRLNTAVFALLIFLSLPVITNAQTRKLSLTEALTETQKAHPALLAKQQRIEAQKEFQKSYSDIGKTAFGLQYGQYNSYFRDNGFTVSQTIPMPGTISKVRKLYENQTKRTEISLSQTENELAFEVKKSFQTLVYHQQRNRYFISLDSLYQKLEKGAALRFKTGETNLLEKAVAESQRQGIQSQIIQNQADVRITTIGLQALMQSKDSLIADENSMDGFELADGISADMIGQNPAVKLAKKDVEISQQHVMVEKAKLLPDFTIGYFNQSLRGIPLENGTVASGGNRFQGINAGLLFPLWSRPQMARIKFAERGIKASEAELKTVEIQLSNQLKMALEEHKKLKTQLDFLETVAKPTSNLIRTQAIKIFETGSSSLLEVATALKSVFTTEEQLLQIRNQLMQSKFYIQYLISNP